MTFNIRNSMRSLLIVITITLFGFRFRSTEAGLTFLNGKLKGISSSVCIPSWADEENFYQNLEPRTFEVANIFPNFCDIDTNNPGLIDLSYYNGKLIFSNQIEAECDTIASMSAPDRVKYITDLCELANISMQVYLWNKKNSFSSVPGSSAYMGKAMITVTPEKRYLATCNFAYDSSGTPMVDEYLMNVIMPALKDGNLTYYANVSFDTNTWLPYFNSPLYQLFFRWFLFFAFFSAAMYAAFWARKKKSKTVIVVILSLEAFQLTILSLHFLFGGWATSDYYPTQLHLMLFTQLMGLSFASSLYCGIFFSDMEKRMNSLKNSKGFFRRNAKLVQFLAIACAGVDVLNMVLIYFWIDGVEMIVSAFNIFCQVVVGTMFVTKMRRFIKSTTKLTIQSTPSFQSNSASANSSNIVTMLKKMAKNLLVCGCCMLVFVFNILLMGMSGGSFAGFWSPVGYCVISAVTLISRFGISLAKILMVAPPEKRKPATRNKGNSSVGTASSGSMTNSTVDSNLSKSFVSSESKNENEQTTKLTHNSSCITK